MVASGLVNCTIFEDKYFQGSVNIYKTLKIFNTHKTVTLQYITSNPINDNDYNCHITAIKLV